MRAQTGRRTTWTGLCRAIVADGFVQMVHIPLVVLWVRNALPRDDPDPGNKGQYKHPTPSPTVALTSNPSDPWWS